MNVNIKHVYASGPGGKQPAPLCLSEGRSQPRTAGTRNAGTARSSSSPQAFLYVNFVRFKSCVCTRDVATEGAAAEDEPHEVPECRIPSAQHRSRNLSPCRTAGRAPHPDGSGMEGQISPCSCTPKHWNGGTGLPPGPEPPHTLHPGPATRAPSAAEPPAPPRSRPAPSIPPCLLPFRPEPFPPSLLPALPGHPQLWPCSADRGARSAGAPRPSRRAGWP